MCFILIDAIVYMKHRVKFNPSRLTLPSMRNRHAILSRNPFQRFTASYASFFAEEHSSCRNLFFQILNESVCISEKTFTITLFMYTSRLDMHRT